VGQCCGKLFSSEGIRWWGMSTDPVLSGTPFPLPEHVCTCLCLCGLVNIYRLATCIGCLLCSSMNPVSVQLLELVLTTTPESTELQTLIQQGEVSSNVGHE